ncbi:PP2C family protein-serine/threonine phosphatase [Xinfangfangia sp. D13-10-4-6]|uniref:PP2C family protein-serine/threonine phosphatase n=1 Tax=Pseudogemmobacter hezensis TaxID=2737662 RepID=UPI001556851A|nr:PP2C family protein-serine/threonine phosphatase [Pseudogemmobacter hezensis]NPD14906.1 PP2C family protein-serine/threonine phosphatase [Pseudogemmobacter hezensis]
MTLQNRLILTLCAALALVAAALVYAGQRQTAVVSRALSDRLLQDQAGLMASTSQSAARDLAAWLQAALPEDPTGRTGLVGAMRGALATRPDLIAEFYDSAGGLLFASAGGQAPLLDRFSLRDLLDAGQGQGLWLGPGLASGLGSPLGPGRGPVILVARTWESDEGRVTLLLAAPAGPMFAGLQAQLGAQSLTLRDLRGRVVPTAGETDQEAGAEMAGVLRQPAVEWQEKTLWLGTPVYGFDGRQVAQLSGFYPLPPLPATLPWLGLAALIGLLAALITGQQLRPLNAALICLNEGAAQGSGTPSLQQAVETAGRNRRRIEEIQLQSSRRQQRQERLIRAEIRKLASALDSGGRDEMLDLLEAGRGQDGAPRDELGLLASVLGHLSRRIEGQHQQLTGMIAELREALVTRARLAGLEQELSIARDVQLSMVPETFPDVPGHRIAGKMIPAKEVGGDFFDFFALDADRYVLMIGDVSGKGVPAALFMAICRTLLRATAPYEADPARCVRRVNDILEAENGQMLFVTLFFGIYDARSGVLDYVNAGHNPPLLCRHGGAPALLPLTGDMALAVMGGEQFSAARLVLAPGDLLLTYTDGVTEATDPGEALYGEARLIALAQAAHDQGPETLLETLLADLERFAAGSDQADDITVLALQHMTGGR